MKTIQLFLIFVMFSYTGHAQWRWLNPLPQGNLLTDITFTTPTKGFAVGYSGVLVITEDSGNSWNYAGNVGLNDIESIFFLNPDTGWICGYGFVSRTYDGGSTWIPVNPPGQNDVYNDIYFTTSSTGFLSGEYGELFYSVDGGDSWTLKTTGTDENLHEIFFVSDQIGFVTADNGDIIKTINGGLTWNSYYTGVDEDLYSAWFLNENTGYIGGYWGTMLKTINGGSSWTPINLNLTSTVYSMSFINENVGFLGTSNNGVMRTVNGGTSWESSLIGDYDDIYRVFAINQNVLFASSEKGGIWKSTDGGVTFSNLQTFSNTHLQYGTIAFADENVGCISGDDGFLMRTSNKGITWDSISLPAITSFKRIKFYNNQMGWLVGSVGKALQTLDGGLTWTEKSTGTFYGLLDVFIGDPTHLWCGATLGRIYKSIDAETWVEIITPTTQNINKIEFYDLQNGMAVGNNGTILKTTDGGDNWTLLSSGVTSIINTIMYLSSDTLIAGTVNGKILRSVNNGQNWTTISLPVNREVRSLIKTNTDTIYAFTNYGHAIFSVDKGLTWSLINRFTACNLREVAATPNGDLYVCGFNGMIMTDAQNNVGINEYWLDNYKNLVLFPNPTSDILHYPNQSNQRITYQVFDLVGKFVQAGYTDNQEINIGKLNPGTYLIRSIIDNQIFISKVMKM
jgi:photosystem II stability/assembly factor-like uncharacterized protein